VKELKEVIIFYMPFDRVLSHCNFPKKLLKRYFELSGLDPAYYIHSSSGKIIKYTGDFDDDDRVLFSSGPPRKGWNNMNNKTNLLKHIKRDDPIFINLMKDLVMDGYYGKQSGMEYWGAKIVKVPYDVEIEIIIVSKAEVVVDKNRIWR